MKKSVVILFVLMFTLLVGCNNAAVQDDASSKTSSNITSGVKFDGIKQASLTQAQRTEYIQNNLLMNFDSMFEYKGELYFSILEDNNGLFKLNKDGKLSKIYEDSIAHAVVIDDVIFGFKMNSMEDFEFMQINPDGSGFVSYAKEKHSDNYVAVDKDNILMERINSNDDKVEQVVFNTKTKTFSVSDLKSPSKCILEGDTVFYIGIEDNEGVFVSHKDGSESKKLADDADLLQKLGESIYYSNIDGIFKVKPNGEQEEKIVDKETDKFIIFDNNMFITSKEGLHWVNMNSSDSKVIDTTASSLFIIEDYIFYTTYSNSKLQLKQCKISTLSSGGTPQMIYEW